MIFLCIKFALLFIVLYTLDKTFIKNVEHHGISVIFKIYIVANQSNN